MKKGTNFWGFFILLAVPLLLVALVVVVIDPFFHYHKPIAGLSYSLYSERYQNDGIVKNFEYEAMITGSSVTQNFKASDFERLWGVSCIKTCFAGGRFKEVDSLVKKALKNNPDIKYVVRSLDVSMLSDNKDAAGYDNLPTFLYDVNPFNDYEYLFNADVLIGIGEMFINQIKGVPTTSFDDYSSWGFNKPCGKEAVLSNHIRPEIKQDGKDELSDEAKAIIEENMTANFIDTAKEHPNTIFYIFVPPYSVCTWDTYVRTGAINSAVDGMKYAAELFMQVENVRFYDFSSHTEITGNLDNYLDPIHYNATINSYILENLHNEEGLLTADNYEDYYEMLKSLYMDFDYDAVLE